jgi:glycosyltransferase involved in cell wall biosynthesis
MGAAAMKILMLHPHDLQYFPWTIRIIRLGLELARAGHEVTLGYIKLPERSLTRNEKKIRDELPEGIRYLPLGTRARHFFSNLARLRGERPPYDLVHVQKCFSTVTIPALYLAYSLDIPIHYDWDDNEAGLAEEWVRFTPARWEVKLYERLMPRLVDSMTAASEELHRRAIQRGMRADSIFPAPVGANLETFHPARSGERVRKLLGLGDEPVVIYMGQLGGAAYANLLLDAVPFILKQSPWVKFLIVGGGRQLKDLKHLVDVTGIGANVLFTDYVPQDEVPDYVAAADIAVATFIDNEITRCKSPLKVAEYLAAGNPIVASAVGEVPRMVEGCGQLIRPGSVQDIVQAVLRYVNDPVLRRTHGEAGRRRAEETYNWEATARSLMQAYAKAFENRGREMPRTHSH